MPNNWKCPLDILPLGVVFTLTRHMVKLIEKSILRLATEPYHYKTGTHLW